jgi:autotransporter-associated beta strand protein
MSSSIASFARCRFVVLALIAAFVSMGRPEAEASVWTNLVAGNASGGWGVAANWSGGIPNGTDTVADLSTLNLTADSTVANETPRTVGSLLFGDTTPGNNWALSGSTLTLAVSGGAPAINVSNQTASLSLVLAGNQGFSKQGSGTLALLSTNTYGGATVVTAGTLRLPAMALPSGTAGYWQFNNPTNLGLDSSGRGNTLQTASGSPAYALGRFGGGLYLDGSSTLTTAGFPSGVPTGSSAYTIALWEKADMGCPNNGGLVGWGTGANSDNNLRLNGPNSVDNYWFANDFVVSGLAVNPLDGNWHAIVVTWDGTTQVMYVDGVSVGTRTPGTLPTVGGADFVVGKTTADVNFKGWLENLLIVNRALSVAEAGAYQAGGISGSNLLPGGTAVQMSGGVLEVGGAAQSVSALTGPASASVLLGGGSLTVNNTASGSFDGVIGGSGSLIKTGASRWTLNGSNTYTGMITISAGTLALGSTGSIANTLSIAVAGGVTLDVSGVSGGYHLANGQTLSGSGTVNGAASVDKGATVQPSGGNGTATLNFGGGLSLAGDVVMNINRASAQKADLIVAPGLSLGGTVVVRNVGATPVLGDSFQLFSVLGGITNAGCFPVLPALGTGVHWDYSQLAVNGTITVASGPPTLFDVRNYEAKGDGVADDYPAINSAIQAAIATGPGSVVSIPGGTYLLNSGQTLVLNNASGITVQGDTNTLLINGNMAPSDTFSIQGGSQNITFNMLQLDVAPLRFTQGTITSIDQKSNTCTVTIDSGYDPPNRADLAAQTTLRIWTDPGSITWDQNYQPAILTNRAQLSPGVWQFAFSSTPKSAILGKKFALWNYGGGWGVNIADNTGNILMQDVAWYGGGAGAGFGISRNRGAITLRRASVGIPPGSNRLIGGTGGIGVQGNRGAITYDTCSIAYNDDDRTDSGTDLTHILTKLGPAQIQVENGNGYMAGDTVSIWDWTYMAEHERDRATVTQVVQNTNNANGPTWNLTLDHDMVILRAGPTATNDWGTVERDGIDRVCDFNTAASLTISNSSLSSMRARSLLLKSPNSLIVSNYFHGSPMAGIQCGTETYWHGGPQLLNLIIRGNTFEDIDYPAIDLGIFTSTNSLDCTNILIEGNTFINNGEHAPYADGIFGPIPAYINPRGVGV